MDLSKDFIGLDSFSNTISKGEFLKRVASGNYLPVRLLSDSASKIYYRLYKLNTSVDPYITTMLASIGAVAYKDYRWEGLALPEINYTDLNGKKYNSDFIKDKTLVLDFWFIGCTACVHEFPELNKLKNKYAGAKDMLFVGIAWDKEKDLRKFLKKTDFQFDVVSDTSAYLAKTLGIQFFPTEVVVKNGKVVKTFDDQYHALPDLKLMLKNVTPD
jgi:peroxiredoxin